MKDGDPPTDVPFTCKNEYRLCGYGYAYDIGKKTIIQTGGAEKDEYGLKVKSGDIVTMHCDMIKLELSFSVNGMDQGIAYHN